ncbi:hypothetical protein [Granulibacter bethesdensis]|uniref:hypothetical protein n=1 Tax=Granulibacter bethesdensis TaxID=364410 RepID=UPI0003F200FF|nr:hypothetical protein [Granulibacter bethesdensis]AHJ66380.1 Transporter [Granulibacter bethesdensis CGDNIH4]AHJ69326.1 Transporter [Granulibacter bethesdensis]
MKYYILRESAPGSGSFLQTGEIRDTTAAEVSVYCETLTTVTGARHGSWPWNEINSGPAPAAPATGISGQGNKTLTQAGTAVVVVPYSASRTYLGVYNRSVGTEQIDIGSAAVQPGGGTPVDPGAGFVFVGAAARGPIYAVSPVAGTPISWTEA